jgi:stress-induced morphogen
MTKNEAELLAKALKKQFGGKTEYELVNDRGRYRFAITSKRFDTMAHLARQDQIWEIVNSVLSREAKMDISTILAYSPADLAALR